MLLELHDEYTYQALIQITDLDRNQSKEILKGSFVNDLCELTNEYTNIKNSLDRYVQMKKEKGLLDYSAFYQSHWGELSAFHCMANIKGELPEVTQSKILNWLKFLEFIIFNINEYILKNKINEFQDILGNQVKNLKFKISTLLDTNDVFKAKYRALGMIIHIIQDSYTVSHCKREDLYIKEFYCYKEQSTKIHKENDYVEKYNEDSLFSNMNQVLIKILQGDSAEIYYNEIFKLSDTTFTSSGGGFN